MRTYHLHWVEYSKFMFYFRSRYKKLFESYHSFIMIDTEGSGKAVIRKANNISPVAEASLCHIIREYYNTFDN